MPLNPRRFIRLVQAWRTQRSTNARLMNAYFSREVFGEATDGSHQGLPTSPTTSLFSIALPPLSNEQKAVTLKSISFVILKSISHHMPMICTKDTRRGTR